MIRCSLVVYRFISEWFLNVATIRFSYITKGGLAPTIVILIREALKWSFTDFDRLELCDSCIEKVVSNTAFLGVSFGACNGLRNVYSTAFNLAQVGGLYSITVSSMIVLHRIIISGPWRRHSRLVASMDGVQVQTQTEVFSLVASAGGFRRLAFDER